MRARASLSAMNGEYVACRANLALTHRLWLWLLFLLLLLVVGWFAV